MGLLKKIFALLLIPFAVTAGLPPVYSVGGIYSAPRPASGGGGGITFKAIIEGSAGSGGTDWNLTGTLNVAAGDLVVVGCGGTVDATAVTVGGQACTKINSTSAGGYNRALWYLANATANASATVNIAADGANFVTGSAACYSGLSTTPLDKNSCESVSCNATVDSVNLTAQNVTTTTANQLLVFWSATDANHSTFTAGSSFTVRTAAGTKSWVLADRIVSSTGTYPSGTIVTVSTEADNVYWSGLATFKQ